MEFATNFYSWNPKILPKSIPKSMVVMRARILSCCVTTYYPLNVVLLNLKSVEALQVTALFPPGSVERLERGLRAFHTQRWHVHVFLSLTPPLPPAHTQRGYDQVDYKTGQRQIYHSYHFTALKDVHGHTWKQMQAESWLYTESWIRGTDIRGFLLGEETNMGQGFPKGELSSSENPCDKLPTDLTENFTGI